MKNENGNALFLILIAVALFAALSYALTTSGRGSGGIDREQAEIASAQIFNYSAAMHNTHQRLKIASGYDQVHLNFVAENAAGTCYSGATTYTCRSIGMFNSETGLVPPDIEKLFDTAVSDNRSATWISARVTDGTNDYGTSAPDTFVAYRSLRDEICAAINQKATGSSAIPAVVTGTDAQGQAANHLQTDDTATAIGTAPNLSYEIPTDNSCYDFGGANLFVTILETN